MWNVVIILPPSDIWKWYQGYTLRSCRRIVFCSWNQKMKWSIESNEETLTYNRAQTRNIDERHRKSLKKSFKLLEHCKFLNLKKIFKNSKKIFENPRKYTLICPSAIDDKIELTNLKICTAEKKYFTKFLLFCGIQL